MKPLKRKKMTMQEKVPFLLSFLLPMLIMIGIFIQRGIYPFGNNSFLRTDMYHQYAPFMNEFLEKLRHGSSLSYSFHIGLGEGFTALYAYYLASPFNWFGLLFPQSHVIEFMTYLIVLKISLSGLTFCIYLSRHFKTKRPGLAFFAVFYAMSAYMAAYSWNIMWLDCLMLAPLVLLGLELLVSDGKPLLYCITLALSILTNYYISIMMCIFLVFYFLTLLVMARPETTVLRREDGTEEVAVRRFPYLDRCLRFAVYSLLAGGIAAILLIPVARALQSTASGDISFPKTLTSYFPLADMLARQLPLIDVEIGLDHWPNLYCGTAVLLLFPLYMMNQKISLREKIAKGTLLIFMLIGFSFNIPNFIWHGFHYPNSLPARQSFLYIALLLTLCCEAYLKLREVKAKQLGISFAIAFVFIFFCEKTVTDDAFPFWVFYVSLLILALYALLLYAYHKGRLQTAVLMILTATLVSSEAALNMGITSITTTSRSAYLENQDSYQKLCEDIRRTDPDLYRIEKATRKTKNDGALAGYASASLFSSTANASLTQLYKTFGMEGNTNAYSFTGSTPLTSALLGIRYTLSLSDLPNELYTEVAADGNVTLYENRYHLPIGFMLPAAMEADQDWSTYSFPADVQNDFAIMASGCSDILVSVNGGQPSDGSYTFTVPETGFYYVDVTNSRIKDVSLSGGTGSREFSNTDRGYLLDLGSQTAGTTLTLTSKQTEESFSALVYRLDLTQLERLTDTLNEQPLILDEHTDSSLSGHITAKEDGLLYLSIAYEKGWTLMVDGVETEPCLFAGAMISVPLTAGQHTIRLTYHSDGLKEGALLSLASVLILILLTILPGLLDRRQTQKERLKKTHSGSASDGAADIHNKN